MANLHLLINTPSSLIQNNKWRITQQLSVDEFRGIQAENMKHVGNKLMIRKVDEENPFEGLLLVDALQKMGIDYHFDKEINYFLDMEYKNYNNKTFNYTQDILHVSLWFRLLRQHGYYVPADVFNNFTCKEGRIKQNLEQNSKALMGLYEASQLSIQGEDTLDFAGNISERLLNAMLSSEFVSDDEAIVVRNTLRHPYHKSLPKFTVANNFLRYYDGPNQCKNALLELAQMDSHMARSIHRNELFEILRWWKELGLGKELKLAREQPIKWYTWPMAVISDPRLSKQRIQLTKPISLIYIIDDIFDVYAPNLHHLTLFTQAVNSWDLATTEQLPDYMKICFKALYDITNEIGYMVYKEYGWNPKNSLQKAWGSLLNAFLVEAKWFASGHVPMADEYLNNGIISSGMHVVLVHLFFLLGEGRDDKSASILNDNTTIITCVATILRLWDDLGSAKDENQDGHDGSYMTCYAKEHEGSSMETARQQVIIKISETWKQLNKECLSLKPFSPTFTRASLNFARMVPLMYSYDENQGLPELEEHIKFMLDL